EEQALVVPRLVDSVLRPLADAVITASHAGATAAGLSRADLKDGTHNQPPGGTGVAECVWASAKAATGLRARLGRASSCPAGLAQATAALQDLAVRLASPADAAARRAELWRLQAGLPATIGAARNGPYLVTNLPRMTDHLGAETRPLPQLALCRCGNSASK